MAKELSFLEQLCYNTTRIVTINKNGEKCVATGFFLSFPLVGQQDLKVPVLVTNRHVTQDAKQLTIWLNAMDENGDPIDNSMVEITIDNASDKFIMHPNSTIDLSIMPIASLIEEAEIKTNNKLFFRNFPIDFIMTDDKAKELDAVEDILMVGYQSGLWDKINNRPIFRYGVTATDPKVDYEGNRVFLIDCACIQGSSGSPVIIYHKGISSDKFGKETKYGGVFAKLLGVQFSIPIRNTAGEMIKVATPTSDEVKPVVGLPINLGFIVKIQCILDFIPILEMKYHIKIKS